ncbi:MAG: hypothetical protein IH621_16420 [Krumholzibacteria bacterium]|nr:hypothetical protein [Candidatus Krumholzibacteria bacterium]
MRMAANLLLILLAAGPARAQPVGPEQAVGPADRRAAPGRFELGFVYGLAAFTAGHDDAAWYDGAPTGGGMDLATTPTLGLGLAWSAAADLRFGLRATWQDTRLEVDAAAGTLQTDLSLLHLHLAAEATFGGGRLRPLLGLAAGGTLASAEGADAAWHYSAAPELGMRFAVDPRAVLRLTARAPLIWANGTLVPQAEIAAGAALVF